MRACGSRSATTCLETIPTWGESITWTGRYPGRTAIASLQPLVNLARLTGRAGDPEGAQRRFDGISRAAHNGGSATVHATSVSFDGFTATDSDRSKVSPWLRALLREDNTRALAAQPQAGRAIHRPTTGGNLHPNLTPPAGEAICPCPPLPSPTPAS